MLFPFFKWIGTTETQRDQNFKTTIFYLSGVSDYSTTHDEAEKLVVLNETKPHTSRFEDRHDDALTEEAELHQRTGKVVCGRCDFEITASQTSKSCCGKKIHNACPCTCVGEKPVVRFGVDKCYVCDEMLLRSNSFDKCCGAFKHSACKCSCADKAKG